MTVHLRELTIAFVGAGSIAEALIKGMVSTGTAKAGNIRVTNRSRRERLEALRAAYGVTPSHSADAAVDGADVVVLCPKPADMAGAIAGIGATSSPDALYISVAAGPSIDWISSELAVAWSRCGRRAADASRRPQTAGGEVWRPRVARTMPNTSCAVLESATGYAMGAHCTRDDADIVHLMFGAVGTAYPLDEEQLDAVTGLSGSGPAYFYYMVECLTKAGIDGGLEESTAAALVLQTLFGAAAMLRFTAGSPASLRERVTSPGGTTQAGLAVLRECGFEEAVRRAVARATERAGEMGAAASAARAKN